jgi:hypothetical protein
MRFISMFFFLCHSIDLKLVTLAECVRLLLKFRFRVEFFDFRVASLPVLRELGY